MYIAKDMSNVIAKFIPILSKPTFKNVHQTSDNKFPIFGPIHVMCIAASQSSFPGTVHIKVTRCNVWFVHLVDLFIIGY